MGKVEQFRSCIWQFAEIQIRKFLAFEREMRSAGGEASGNAVTSRGCCLLGQQHVERYLRTHLLQSR
jgi:hypothetical protein